MRCCGSKVPSTSTTCNRWPGRIASRSSRIIAWQLFGGFLRGLQESVNSASGCGALSSLPAFTKRLPRQRIPHDPLQRDSVSFLDPAASDTRHHGTRRKIPPQAAGSPGDSERKRRPDNAPGPNLSAQCRSHSLADGRRASRSRAADAHSGPCSGIGDANDPLGRSQPRRQLTTRGRPIIVWTLFLQPGQCVEVATAPQVLTGR